jgi:hypothetical protein
MQLEVKFDGEKEGRVLSDTVRKRTNKRNVKQYSKRNQFPAKSGEFHKVFISDGKSADSDTTDSDTTDSDTTDSSTSDSSTPASKRSSADKTTSRHKA